MTSDEHTRLWMPGRPVPYDRAVSAINRRTGRPMRVHSQRYRDWRTVAAQAARYAARTTWADPVGVWVGVEADRVEVVITPHTATRPKGVRGDIDNYAKSVLDALQQGGVLADDRLVETLTVTFATGRGET